MFITVTAGMSVYVVEDHQGMGRRETNFCNVQECPWYVVEYRQGMGRRETNFCNVLECPGT